jgi:hypothetical protein
MPRNSSATRVEIERTNLTERGQRYRMMYAGEILAEGRRNPIFDACRALLARGITGRLEVWRRGKPSADMQLDIERGAGLAIEESDKKSIRLRRWVPMPLSRARGETTAVSLAADTDGEEGKKGQKKGSGTSTRCTLARVQPLG